MILPENCKIDLFRKGMFYAHITRRPTTLRLDEAFNNSLGVYTTEIKTQDEMENA